MKSEYVTLLTVTISLLSGWGGAFIGGYFSRKGITDSIDKERMIEIEKSKEEERIELLNLYVAIIKLDFEKSPVIYGLNGESDFDFQFFRNEIRPRIYDKYYLIDSDVIDIFNQIEIRNAVAEQPISLDNFNEDEISFIALTYETMIVEIKLLVNEHRLSLFSDK